METKKCVVCEKPVEQTPGKKEKKYCSSVCRQKDWQRKRREEIAAFRGRGGVPLPTDYVNFDKIGIMGADGIIKEVLNTEIPTDFEKPAEPAQKKEELPKEAERGFKGTSIFPNPPLSKEEQQRLVDDGIKRVQKGFSRAAIEKQIAEIKAEKIPENRSKSPMGIKSWNLDQKKRIRELENKLK